MKGNSQSPHRCTTMFKFASFLLAVAMVATLISKVSSFSLSMKADTNIDRRSFGQKVVGTATAAAVAVVTTSNPLQPAFADGDHADFTTTESGLRYKVTKEGTGKVPEAGMTVSAHYTGWLDDFDSIKKFDSSRDRGRPFSFKVGAGQVIRGWDEGMSCVRVCVCLMK